MSPHALGGQTACGWLTTGSSLRQFFAMTFRCMVLGAPAHSLMYRRTFDYWSECTETDETSCIHSISFQWLFLIAKQELYVFWLKHWARQLILFSGTIQHPDCGAVQHPTELHCFIFNRAIQIRKTTEDKDVGMLTMHSMEYICWMHKVQGAQVWGSQAWPI